MTERKTRVDPGPQKTLPSPGATFMMAPTAGTALHLPPVSTQRGKEQGPLQRAADSRSGG